MAHIATKGRFSLIRERNRMTQEKHVVFEFFSLNFQVKLNSYDNYNNRILSIYARTCNMEEIMTYKL